MGLKGVFMVFDEVEDVALSGEKFGARARKGIRVGEEIYEVAANAFALEHGFASVGHMAEEIKSLRASVDELIDAQKGFKLSNMGKSGEQLIEAEGEAAEDISRMSKFLKSPIGRAGKALGKTAWKYKKGIMKLGVLGGGAGYLYNEYALPEYEELKRDCQCTCQGFNKLNLNDEKWEKLNKILYCRDDDGAPCELVNGECPEDGCTLKNNNKKSASLYGITNPSSFESNSPQYTDWEGKTDNMLCPLNNDSEFKDDFKHYHIQRAAELSEIGVASGATLDAQFNNEMLGAAGGFGAATVAGEFIPTEFPGHCLHRLFDSSLFKTNPTDATGEEEHQDLKVVKCQGNASEAGPDADGKRKKCSLKAGEEGTIISDGNQATYNNRDLGTCVAWNKGDGGKCMSVIHAPKNVFYALKGELQDNKDIDCSVLNTEATCEESEYCYWKNETNFDDIYMCLNDVTLIQMHNDILDGGVRGNLISSTNDQAYRTEKEKITDDTYKIDSLNNYNNNKETDINDICNAYCNDSLCNNPAIATMPAVPGLQNATDGIKNIIKYVILFGLTLLLWNNIVSEFFKQKTSGNLVSIRMGMFNINRLLSMGSLMTVLIIVYLYADIISEKIKIDEFIDNQILPLIEENI